MYKQRALFDKVTNNRWFTRKPLILVMTNIDLLDETLELSPIDRFFAKFARLHPRGSVGFKVEYLTDLEDRFKSLTPHEGARRDLKVIRSDMFHIDSHVQQRMFLRLLHHVERDEP